VISFIIPAHNEQELIGGTLSALHQATSALDEPYELIVVDDASTDRTGAIAQEHGAILIAVNNRQIAATRNAGARTANGDKFFFVDADTMVTEQALRAAIRALRRGAVGGGCATRFDGQMPVYAMVLERLLPPILHVFALAPGCFLFCTRKAYLAAGGFNEAMYWGEEVAFCRRLKGQGRFVMLREFVITSGRKLRSHTALGLLRVAARLALKRHGALEYWYGR